MEGLRPALWKAYPAEDLDDDPTIQEYRRARIELLRRGETQWGHDGRHNGSGRDDCPRWLHHHHDIRCEYPTLLECDEAGVEYRPPGQWGSRR